MICLYITTPSNPYETFGDHSECINCNWYHRHLHVPSHTPLFFLFFDFRTVVRRTAKSTIQQVLFSFFNYHSIWPRLSDLLVSHNPIEFCKSHSPGQILVNTIWYIYHYLSVFSFTFVFLQSLTQDLAWGKVVIICILFIYLFAASFGDVLRNDFFYINHFSLIIFLSFGLVGSWTIRLLVQGYKHWVQFTLVRKGYDNHKCHNKIPR